jgi:regulator of cell morphogenesis and NO signaling
MNTRQLTPTSAYSNESSNKILQQDIGTIVKDNPLRARVIEASGLGFSCGLRDSLVKVCNQNDINPIEIVNSIQACDGCKVSTKFDSWTLESIVRHTIQHIRQKHHARLKKELPLLHKQIDAFTKKLGKEHAEIIQIREIFQTYTEEVMLHLLNEESFLFPRLESNDLFESWNRPLSCELNDVESIVDAEDEEILHEYKEIREAAASIHFTGHEALDYRIWLEALIDLELDLEAHIREETHLLWPLANLLNANNQSMNDQQDHCHEDPDKTPLLPAGRLSHAFEPKAKSKLKSIAITAAVAVILSLMIGAELYPQSSSYQPVIQKNPMTYLLAEVQARTWHRNREYRPFNFALKQ